MQGLLDLLDKPAVQGLLAAGLGAAASAGRGRGLLGNLGQGGLMGLQAYSGAQQNQLAAADRAKMTEYRDMQMQSLRQKMEQERKDEEMFQSIFGPQPTPPSQPGQLGSGSFGIMPTAAGVPAIPAAPAAGGQRIPSLTFDQLAMLKRRGLDLTELHKYANDPMKMEAGSTYVNRVTGQREYMPRLPEGATVSNGRVGAMPGYMDLLTQTTLAQEAPKTLLGAAGRLNLRDNPDGTKSPVSELQENPTLQDVLGGVFGRPVQPNAAPVPMQAPASRPQAASQPGRPVISPVDQKGADAESIRMIQDELKNPNLSPADKAALQREVQRLTVAQGQSGFPTPTLVRPGIGYGKTTAQETAEAVEKQRLLDQAKADIKPTAQKEKSLLDAQYLYNTIGKALNHDGRETATGLSGTLDPRNYMAGTKAKDFRVLLDQIQGSAFLQAFESLKGGGAITQIEGEKAERAIARLNTAQSDGEFKSALEEFQGVVKTGMDRINGGTLPTQQTPAAPSEPPKAPPPKPIKGMVRNGYRFKGGDPSKPENWEKQ